MPDVESPFRSRELASRVGQGLVCRDTDNLARWLRDVGDSVGAAMLITEHANVPWGCQDHYEFRRNIRHGVDMTDTNGVAAYVRALSP